MLSCENSIFLGSLAPNCRSRKSPWLMETHPHCVCMCCQLSSYFAGQPVSDNSLLTSQPFSQQMGESERFFIPRGFLSTFDVDPSTRPAVEVSEYTHQAGFGNSKTGCHTTHLFRRPTRSRQFSWVELNCSLWNYNYQRNNNRNNRPVYNIALFYLHQSRPSFTGSTSSLSPQGGSIWT